MATQCNNYTDSYADGTRCTDTSTSCGGAGYTITSDDTTSGNGWIAVPNTVGTGYSPLTNIQIVPQAVPVTTATVKTEKKEKKKDIFKEQLEEIIDILLQK